MTQLKRFLVAGLLSLAFFAVAPVKADQISYADPTTVGNQAWIGTLGQDFTVNSPITVSALGVFDSGQNGIAGPITVAIYSSNGTQVTPILTFSSTTTGTTAIGGDLFLNLNAPITLGPGNYSITTQGWTNKDPNGNGTFSGYTAPVLNNAGGLITYTGIGWNSGGMGYLAPIAPYPAGEFDAGSFEFSGVPAPEPGAALSLLVGLLALSVFAIRRQAFQR